jgi:radical SAM protein with 4Fe4S-binding SPASM domain
MREHMKDEVGFIDWKTFKSVFIGTRPISVKLNWRGEPLLHPDIAKLVEYAKSFSDEVSFNTNGLLLTKELIKDLSDAGLDWLIISVDGATKYTYEKIRRGAKFDTLMSNIELLNRMNVKFKVRLQICKQPDNENEIKLWKRTFMFLADSIRVGNRFDPQGKNGYKVRQPKSCPQPWQRLTVSWKGDIHPCPSDYLGKVNLGNVHDETVASVWNSMDMQHIRGFLREGGRQNFQLCRNCTSYC